MEIFRDEMAEKQLDEFRARLEAPSQEWEYWCVCCSGEYRVKPDLAEFDRQIKSALERRGRYDRIFVFASCREIFSMFENPEALFSGELSILPRRQLRLPLWVHNRLWEIAQRGFAIHADLAPSPSIQAFPGIH